MTKEAPDVIRKYLEADARRDTDAVLALFFSDGAEMVDDGGRWTGVDEIRSWRHGPVAKYRYKNEIDEVAHVGNDEYVASGRITGNFPGGRAELRWRFSLVGGRIRRLEIAP